MGMRSPPLVPQLILWTPPPPHIRSPLVVTMHLSDPPPITTPHPPPTLVPTGSSCPPLLPGLDVAVHRPLVTNEPSSCLSWLIRAEKRRGGGTGGHNRMWGRPQKGPLSTHSSVPAPQGWAGGDADGDGCRRLHPWVREMWGEEGLGDTPDGTQGDPVAVPVVPPMLELSPHLLCPHCPHGQGASTAIPMVSPRCPHANTCDVPVPNTSLLCTHPSTQGDKRGPRGGRGGGGDRTGTPCWALQEELGAIGIRQPQPQRPAVGAPLWGCGVTMSALGGDIGCPGGDDGHPVG